MAIDVQEWDKRIVADLKERMNTYDRKWQDSRNVLKNAGNKVFYANLAKEFAATVRNRLISQNFMVKVTVDDPDFNEKAQKLTIMSNSIARSLSIKDMLDDTAETSIWAGTGWLEVGHSLDFHSFDPDRSFLYKNNPNSFDKTELEDEYVEVPESSVDAYAGQEKENIVPFDPFSKPNIKEEKSEPMITFDPSFGAPWIREISPFFIIIPSGVKNFEDADYVTKLVLISKQELSKLTSMELPEEDLFSNKYQSIIEHIPGSKYIKNKVLVAVTYIRRDRNAPECSSYYLAHVLERPDIVIKVAPNPYGGMIPIIPIKIRKECDYLDRAYIEDLIPHTEENSKIVKAAYRRIRRTLGAKWTMDGTTSMSKTDKANFENPDFSGAIKLESGSNQGIQPVSEPGLTQDIMQGINLAKNLSQGASNLSDMDRGTPIKKISARQTDALLKNSDITLEAMRVPISRSAAEIILKLIHLLNLFSPPKAHVFYFGNKVVDFKPGSNDFTASYSYRFTFKDLEGPEDPEQQIVLVNFITRIVPLLGQYYDLKFIADEVRRAMGFGPEAMNQSIYAAPGAPAGAPGTPPPNAAVPPMEPGGVDGGMEQMVASMMGGPTHPERMPGDQGVGAGAVSNLVAGARR